MRPDDKELATLLNESFVPVRIVNMKGVDLNYFQFDYDLTFAVLMMNANGYVYSRFGTMDHTQSTHRMSIAGLKGAMQGVLGYHRNRGATQARQAGPKFTLEDIPVFAKSRQAKEACYHCHFAGGFGVKQMRAEGEFRKEMVYLFPPPENVGITLEVDRNNVVKSVAAATPAERAGMKSGDVIAQGRRTDRPQPPTGEGPYLPIFTSADLQFLLEHAVNTDMITLFVNRGREQNIPVNISLPKGWRKHDVSWRSSQATFPPTVGIWGEALTDEQKTQRGLAPGKLGLKVTFFFNGPEWAPSRGDLKLTDVIYGLNGEQLTSMTIRQFHSHFRLTYNVGDTVTLNVLRGDQRVDIKVPCTNAGESDV